MNSISNPSPLITPRIKVFPAAGASGLTSITAEGTLFPGNKDVQLEYYFKVDGISDFFLKSVPVKADKYGEFRQHITSTYSCIQ